MVDQILKLFINDEKLKFNKLNEPRIFANSVADKTRVLLKKELFTYCQKER